MTEVQNVAAHLKRMARKRPHQRAVVFPAMRQKNGRMAYSHLTFRQLDLESDCLAHGLTEIGISSGVRTILMVKPSIEFFTLTFALFKTGAVPVVVDPGMGLRRMLNCLKESNPQAFIGIPKAHLMRIFFPKYFRSVKIQVTVGRRWLWRGPNYNSICKRPYKSFPLENPDADDPAAILFTTGSTGPAKGVIYTQGTFNTQIRLIHDQFQIAEGEIDLPTFPLFALFDPALGMTAIIPEMDPTQPAKVNPQRIIEAIRDHGVTNMFASPALLNRVGRYAKLSGIKLSSLKRVVSAGAPVTPRNINRFATLLAKSAEIHTPYGATEAMPVTSITQKEIQKDTRRLTDKGYGVCVGKPLASIDVKIITIKDAPIDHWTDDLVIPRGEIGEIVVKGFQVSRSYFKNRIADQLHKIKENAAFWHRMGDLGWIDKKGRLWFCGRKSQRVITSEQTLYTVPCESIFNAHPAVYRSALVGIGRAPHQTAVILIECESTATDKAALEKELLARAGGYEHTRIIRHLIFHGGFPVDIRHNSKIFREKLALWAEGKLRSRPKPATKNDCKAQG